MIMTYLKTFVGKPLEELRPYLHDSEIVYRIVYNPWQVLTRDYKTDRYNIHVNGDGIITEIKNG